jgi:cytochrome c oxidase cbb3-type subunit 3
MAEKEIDAPTGVETTGHAWDGIKELNTPLPRWWLIVFWATVLWSIAYWVAMPAWPGLSGHTKGLREHSERENVEKAVAALTAERAEQMQSLLAVNNIADIETNPELLQFAMNAGGSLFGDNCATCHGSGGMGAPGYPALVDDDWLWGGTLTDIGTTLHYGVRSPHEKTRRSVMQAFGRDGILTGAQVSDLTDHVLALSGQAHDAAAAARGAPLFAQHCASCHGAEGRGDRAFGAPNLSDAIWLYGGGRAGIHASIHDGRGGVMPAWEGRLTEAQITALAVYVHALGGGE